MELEIKYTDEGTTVTIKVSDPSKASKIIRMLEELIAPIPTIPEKKEAVKKKREVAIEEVKLPDPKFVIKDLGNKVWIETKVYKRDRRISTGVAYNTISFSVKKDHLHLVIGKNRDFIKRAIKECHPEYSRLTLNHYAAMLIKALETESGKEALKTLEKIHDDYVAELQRRIGIKLENTKKAELKAMREK